MWIFRYRVCLLSFIIYCNKWPTVYYSWKGAMIFNALKADRFKYKHLCYSQNNEEGPPLKTGIILVLILFCLLR